MIKKIGTFLLICVIFAAVLWMGNANKKRMNEKIYEVAVEPISLTNTIDTTINVSGSLIARNDKVGNVTLPYNAIVKSILVKNGQYVKAGEPLILTKRYSDEEYNSQLYDLNTELDKIKSQINLAGSGDNELSKSKDRIQKKLAELKANQNFTLKAISSGNISFNRDLNISDAILANESIAKIIDTSSADNFYISAKLEDSEYKNISTKNKVQVNFSKNFSSGSFEGSIEDTLPRVVKENQVTYYYIAIKLNNPNEKSSGITFVPNMPVDVVINSTIEIPKDSSIAGNDNKYYILPVNSIVSRTNKNAVLVYSKKENTQDYYAKLVYVDVLVSNDSNVIVKTNDLNKDSLIITQGNYDLYGGEKVILSKKENSGNLNLNLFN